MVNYTHMNTREDKQRADSAKQDAQEERMAFWDLCKKTNTTPQLVNKLQRLGIVRAPDGRRRGLRQLYDMGAFSEVLAANFLKQFFSLAEVAEIRRLEHTMRDVWESGSNVIMDRVGGKRCWKFFFVKGLWFSFHKGWEKAEQGAKFHENLRKYNRFKAILIDRLNPDGTKISVKGMGDGFLKTALSGPLRVEG